MKLLITDIHHGNGGGHVTYVMGLLKGLQSDFDITVAVPPTGRLFRQASAVPGLKVQAGVYTSRPLVLVDEVRRLRRYLEQARYDVVHVNGGADHRHVMLATLGMKYRPAIVWTKHNTNSVTSVGHRLRARFGTHASIAVCDYVAGLLRDSDYQRAPVHVVRNGIDVDAIQPAMPEQKRMHRDALFGALAPDVLVLGSIGGTDDNKGWLLLVKAAAALPDALRARVRIVVAGDPPSAERLSEVQSLGMTPYVCFPGLVSDVRPILAACDAGFVLSFREAASYASCETMAAGLPVLVSSAGGLPENVRDGVDGWVVPVGDVQAIGQRLRQMLAQPHILPAMGAAARQRVISAFSESQFIRDTRTVYRIARDFADTGARLPDAADRLL